MKPSKSRKNYWSRDHYGMLVYCADKVRRNFTQHIDIWDLVNYAWWKHARYNPECPAVYAVKSIMYKALARGDVYLGNTSTNSKWKLKSDPRKCARMVVQSFDQDPNHWYDKLEADCDVRMRRQEQKSASKKLVEQILACIPKLRNREIFRKVMLEGKTKTAVGKEYHLTRERIRQICHECIAFIQDCERTRQWVEEYDDILQLC